jgi:hypothetical protein
MRRQPTTPPGRHTARVGQPRLPRWTTAATTTRTGPHAAALLGRGRRGSHRRGGPSAPFRAKQQPARRRLALLSGSRSARSGGGETHGESACGSSARERMPSFAVGVPEVVLDRGGSRTSPRTATPAAPSRAPCASAHQDSDHRADRLCVRFLTMAGPVPRGCGSVVRTRTAGEVTCHVLLVRCS